MSASSRMALTIDRSYAPRSGRRIRVVRCVGAIVSTGSSSRGRDQEPALSLAHRKEPVQLISIGQLPASTMPRPMPPTEPFAFLDVAIPPDGDLRLILTERSPAEKNNWGVPAYLFRMEGPGGDRIRHIRLRVGWSEDVIRFAGHVGYGVEPAHRGHRYAERACRMIVPLAKRHGMTYLWITCQPDNIPSRRTLERLGAECVGVI